MPAVVVLLFLLTVMTVTTYQLVRMEAVMARQSREIVRAEGIAWAALDRFEGENLGLPADTQVFALDDGLAVIRPRRIQKLSRRRWLYHLSSTATYDDPRSEVGEAERTVRSYAALEHPIHGLAAVSALSGQLYVGSGAFVSGYDVAASDACPTSSGPVAGGFGIMGVSWEGSTLEGSPTAKAAVDEPSGLDSLRIGADTWSTLQALPVDYEDSWPDFGALAADFFPTIRYSGNLSPGSSQSGRGLLIVGGTFQPQDGFAWDGIVLAGDYYSDDDPSFTIRGLMVAGFASTAGNITLGSGADIRYDRCHVTSAGLRLARFEPLDNASWDGW